MKLVFLQAFFMKRYIKIEIEILTEQETEILVALLSEIKFYAFEEGNNLLNAYIHEEDFDENLMMMALPENRFFKKYVIDEENWNHQWEETITPVIINDFVALRPSFAAPNRKVKYDIVITPKMSFGTGHHATTRLMIELMEKIDFYQKSVIDFGTGTGVLSILAEKCGAAKITAIDVDEWSIMNATENILANNCKNISLKLQENLTAIEPADILLANINLNVLTEHAESIMLSVRRGGFFLASGFLLNDEAEIVRVFTDNDFVVFDRLGLNGWLAILFKRNKV
ncbi:50S ribosomal protein L11 methyltransferase [Hanamia caeni]|uniref:Ribosomal protein L11 methyltransferase n=2 Tax=Hanamia caeni TaxID=2294116 RepID=A0A3M9NFH4_9BACT|nr:50S ribosomal protein L11 methyltransferase [Hanamia caeni]